MKKNKTVNSVSESEQPRAERLPVANDIVQEEHHSGQENQRRDRVQIARSGRLSNGPFEQV